MGAWENERERFVILIFSSLRFSLRFMDIGLYIFVGAEDKVGLRDESYA